MGKSVTKNEIVIEDLRGGVKEERVDITEDVIFNASTTTWSVKWAITEAVTQVSEEKVVVVKEAKVAITKTLATLSAKLSVNNKFQQMYSLCGCVYIYDIYFWICYALVSLSEAKKRERKQKEEKEEKKKITHFHTKIQIPSLFLSRLFIRITHKSQSFILFLHPQNSFIHSILSHPV